MTNQLLRQACLVTGAIGLAVMLAACSSSGGDSGGGGGGGGGGSTFSTVLPDNSSEGANPNPMPVSSFEGDGLSTTEVGDVFPLVQSAVNFTDERFGPDDNVNDDGASIEIVSIGAEGPDEIRLIVPGLALDETLTIDGDEEYVGSFDGSDLRVGLLTDLGGSEKLESDIPQVAYRLT